MLWTALIVFLGLCAVYLLIDKVISSIRGHVERKALARSGPQAKLAEDISSKVIEMLEPRFNGIDQKLTSDNDRLNAHERRLAEIDRSLNNTHADNTMLLRAVNLIIMNQITGNGIEALKQFKTEMDAFMAAR